MDKDQIPKETDFWVMLGLALRIKNWIVLEDEKID